MAGLAAAFIARVQDEELTAEEVEVFFRNNVVVPLDVHLLLSASRGSWPLWKVPALIWPKSFWAASALGGLTASLKGWTPKENQKCKPQ